MSAKKRSVEPIVANSSRGSRFTPCPVCGKTVAIPLVNQHLNLCLATSLTTVETAPHLESPSKCTTQGDATNVGAHIQQHSLLESASAVTSDRLRSAGKPKELASAVPFPPAAKRQKTEAPNQSVVVSRSFQEWSFQELVEAGGCKTALEAGAASSRLELGDCRRSPAAQNHPLISPHSDSASLSDPQHCKGLEDREEKRFADKAQSEGDSSQQEPDSQKPTQAGRVSPDSTEKVQSPSPIIERSGAPQPRESDAQIGGSALSRPAEEADGHPLRLQESSLGGASPTYGGGQASRYDHKGTEEQVAPIFRKPNKIIYLIRHGNTTHNSAAAFQPFTVQEELQATNPDASSSVAARTDSTGRIFDVPLSPLGLKQAAALRPKLPGMRAEVVLVSPLTRALQTCQEALGNSTVPIEVTSRHAEHVACCGDVGRPPAVLAEEFPRFDLSRLPSVWWYCPPEAPNHALSGTFLSRESMSHLRERVQRFKAYLQKRPERTIVVIGHSTFFRVCFRELLGSKRRMAHCEVVQLRL